YLICQIILYIICKVVHGIRKSSAEAPVRVAPRTVRDGRGIDGCMLQELAGCTVIKIHAALYRKKGLIEYHIAEFYHYQLRVFRGSGLVGSSAGNLPSYHIVSGIFLQTVDVLLPYFINPCAPGWITISGMVLFSQIQP